LFAYLHAHCLATELVGMCSFENANVLTSSHVFSLAS